MSHKGCLKGSKYGQAIIVSLSCFIIEMGEVTLRRTREEAEETRKKIVKACYETILEKGYEKMTRDDIAVKLGMTRGAVNWHFKDKEQMYLEAIQEVLDELKDKRDVYVNDAALTVEERLHGLFTMPVELADYFHFINHIPHYLLMQDNFKCIEKRKQANRIWFMDYMISCLDDYEKEHGCKLSGSKQTMAQMLYLMYEGLHNRNTAKEYETVDFIANIDEYFKIIIR